MDFSSGYITLDSLLTLNLDQVQTHLNLMQWPAINDLESIEAFYRETRAIFMIIIAIDAFLAQTLVIRCFGSQSHLFALRLILLDEHQTRLNYLSNHHGSSQ
jgi:hypothetical protein